jgi:hypothetical protein
MSESSRKSGWDKAETISKIVSFVATPLLVVFIGATINNSVNRQTVRKDYVSLAVSVLTTPEESVDPAIRDWAVDLLNENSPLKFSPAVTASLKSGDTRFPSSILAEMNAFAAALTSFSCSIDNLPPPTVRLDPSTSVPKGQNVAVSIQLE